MLISLATAAKITLRKPWIMVMPLIAGAVLLVLLFLAGDALTSLIVDTIFLELVPETGFFELPWHLYTQYSAQFNTLAMALLVALGVFAWLGFFFASYAKASLERQESIPAAVRETNSRIKPIGIIVLFFFVLALSLAIGFWLIANASLALGAIGIILPIIYTLLLFFIYITLLFVVPIMSIEKLSLRETIKKSYVFVSKRFWSVVLFGLLVGLVYSLVLNAGDFVSELIPDETISLLVFALFWAAALAFAGLAPPIYYLRKSTA